MTSKLVKILMADDDPEDLELIEDAILQVAPYAELHKFVNGHTIIDFLNSSSDNELPCLIVLDYNMPEINGSQLLSSMKTLKRFEAIPKIVLSTSNAQLHKLECLSNGATDYLVKPDNMKELHALAEKLLAFCKRD